MTLFFIVNYFLSFFIGIIIIVASPILVYFSKKIKKLEQIDIYDPNIKFNMFNLEINDTVENNKFYKNDQKLN